MPYACIMRGPLNRGPLTIPTASFHNFKSQNFKLSASNPKRKYVVYVSVLSQISNSQGLGRKNNFEIMKTDPMKDACYSRAIIGLYEAMGKELQEETYGMLNNNCLTMHNDTIISITQNNINIHTSTQT